MAAEKSRVGDDQQAQNRRRRRPDSLKARPANVKSESSSTRGITPSKSRGDSAVVTGDSTVEKRGNFFTRLGRGLAEYFEGVRSELGKVAWPTREETLRLTRIVVIALIISSLVLGAISLGFTEIFRIGLDTPVLLLGLMIAAVGGGILYNRIKKRSY